MVFLATHFVNSFGRSYDSLHDGKSTMRSMSQVRVKKEDHVDVQITALKDRQNVLDLRISEVQSRLGDVEKQVDKIEMTLDILKNDVKELKSNPKFIYRLVSGIFVLFVVYVLLAR